MDYVIQQRLTASNDDYVVLRVCIRQTQVQSSSMPAYSQRAKRRLPGFHRSWELIKSVKRRMCIGFRTTRGLCTKSEVVVGSDEELRWFLALEILSRRIFAHVENDVQVKLTEAISRFTASIQFR